MSVNEKNECETCLCHRPYRRTTDDESIAVDVALIHALDCFLAAVGIRIIHKAEIWISDWGSIFILLGSDLLHSPIAAVEVRIDREDFHREDSTEFREEFFELLLNRRIESISVVFSSAEYLALTSV